MKTRLPIMISCVAAAASLALLAPASVQARHGPEYPPTPAAVTAPAQATLPDDLNDARLGPKYVTVPVASPAVPVTSAPAVTVVAPDAFDWTDALIGAAVAAAALVTVAAAALIATRHHPDRPVHA